MCVKIMMLSLNHRHETSDFSNGLSAADCCEIDPRGTERTGAAQRAGRSSHLSTDTTAQNVRCINDELT